MSEQSGIDRLNVLIPHLQKHNDEHIKDLNKWMKEAEESGLKGIAEDLKRVIEFSKEIDKCFESAIKKLEGN